MGISFMHYNNKLLNKYGHFFASKKKMLGVKHSILKNQNVNLFLHSYITNLIKCLSQHIKHRIPQALQVLKLPGTLNFFMSLLECCKIIIEICIYSKIYSKIILETRTVVISV